MEYSGFSGLRGSRGQTDGRHFMRKMLLIIIIGAFAMIALLVETDNAEAISTPYITSVYQTNLERQCVKVEWSSSNNDDYSYELEEMNSGNKWRFAGSVSYYYIQGLSAGQKLRLRIRSYDRYETSSYSQIWTITVQSGYGNNNYGYQESGSNSGYIYWNRISTGTWYYDYTVTGDAVYYEFTTSSRAGSKYRLECRGTDRYHVDMQILDYGASPNNEDAWGFAAGGNKDSSTWYSETLALRPNTTYRLRVYTFKTGWGVSTDAEGGIPYQMKVTEVISKKSQTVGRTTIRNTIANTIDTPKYNDVIYDRVAGATGYDVTYRHINSSSWVTKRTGNTIRGRMSGLSIRGLYQVKVRARKAETATYKAAVGAYSPVVYRYFFTVQRIRLKSASKGSFTMSWAKDPGATGYQVMFSTRSNGAGAANNINNIGANGTSFTKRGLQSGRTYYVQVRAIKRVGDKNYIGNISIPVAVRVK